MNDNNKFGDIGVVHINKQNNELSVCRLLESFIYEL